MMSDFTREFIHRNNISFIGMRKTALALLPNDQMVLDKLYNDLKRGKDILDDEIHLNMYLRCFGKMHKAKAMMLSLACLMFHQSFLKKSRFMIGGVVKEPHLFVYLTFFVQGI